MYTKTEVLVKNVYERAKYVFATTFLSREYTDSPVKKKVPGAVVSKEDYSDSFLGNEMTHHY